MITKDIIKPINLNYIDINETGDISAQVLLLVHGSGSSKATWSSIIKPLKSKYRIVAIDLRGHGDSPMPLDSDYSIEEMVADVNSVVEKLDLQRVIFVAHSMGVRIAVPYSARHRDRVKALVLEDLHVRPATKSDLTAEEVEKLKTFRTLHTSLDEAKQELLAFGYKETKIDKFLKDGRIEIKEDGNVKIKVHPYVNHITRNRVSASYETQESFKKITDTPKILMRAEKWSYATDEGVAEMQEVDSGLKVVKIAESVHSIHKSQTKEFLEILNGFIESLN